MTKTFMIAASVLTIAIAAPAFAQNNPETPPVATTTERDIREGWDNTKDAVSKAWDNTKETVSNAADDVAAATDKHLNVQDYTINENTLTAKKLIGSDVVDAKGDKVAKISDVLVDGNGNIQGAVVSNGGFMGVAEKKTLVEFDQLGNRIEDGKYQSALTKKALEATPAYKAETTPNGQFRLSDLVGADISNPAGEKIATADNIVIENGSATKIIVSYMDGLMPKETAINFSDADVQLRKNNEAAFSISMSESADFNRKTR